jgi:hypothetical protein
MKVKVPDHSATVNGAEFGGAMKKRILELHAGSRSIGNVADKMGMEVFSVDWQPFEKINLAIDIELLTPDHIPFIPDAVVSGPDCTTYSITAISHHRNGLLPKTEYAAKCDRVNVNQWNIINYFHKLNPNLKFFVENPRGMMRKMPFVQGIPRTTVWYCTYGDERAKPTDIWTNHLYNPLFNPNGWKPRPECWNGNTNCHHQPAPRGSKTGTQGRRDARARMSEVNTRNNYA